jgi:Protein of unknown function (DUF1615)
MTAPRRLRSSLHAAIAGPGLVAGMACGFGTVRGSPPGRLLAPLVALLLGGCGSLLRPPPPAFDPDAVRAQIADLLPPKVTQRSDWAADLFSALEAHGIPPTTDHLCAVIAVTEQESGFQVNPVVPGLPTIARREIDAKAGRLRIPGFMVSAALELRSPDGRSYRERLAGAKTEKALNDIFEDFIAEVPLGQRLFANFNPVRTAGPMQVSIAWSEQYVQQKRYPFPMSGSVRDEVFTRRGGLYFGIAHLLGYPADYDDMVYRFADFNAGPHASRNAAFQDAVRVATGTQLALDGDLLIDGGRSEAVGQTEGAVRRLGGQLGLSDTQIRADLERGSGAGFDKTRLYARVFEIAERRRVRTLPRAVIPKIRLESPKITRPLTTEWFARRVDERYERCRARAIREGR